MRKINSIVVLVMVMALSSCGNEDFPQVRELAERIIPEHHESFVFEAVEDSSDCYEISMDGEKVLIRASNANSAAVGLNHYLKNYCLTTVSWDARNPVEMPDELPSVEGTVKVNAHCGDRFFLNYCTFGYTMPWWGWNEWERFIDWMALNGVTMPLAITGQEAVWQKVWMKHGLTDEQVRSYFSGPAHLPWHRMSNIDYWQGPLPQEWIDGQAELQKKILKRERELGMTPILPAFAGHVPKELADVYPSIDTTRVSYWGGFADEYRCTFLAPMDSLYAEIQKDFLTVQTEMFGTDHIYGVDPFNEIDAPSWDPQTLGNMAAHIYGSMAAVDPEAVWLQMGWLFYADPAHWTQENIRSFLRAAPQDRLIMLDYYCEFTEIWKQTQEFYGQLYIWCYLGNFGGNTMMSGNFRTVSSRIDDALANGGDNLIGMGSTLEGFGVNMFMYEYILERAWDTGMSDDEWIEVLADRRLGYADEGARKAWRTLCDEVYTEHSKTGHATLTCAHPALEGNWHWTTKPSTNYPAETLWNVWETLLSAESDRDTYEYDVVNVGRQVLGDHFMAVRDQFTEAYKSGDLPLMQEKAAMMLDIIDDMDRLVACHPEFSLKDWVDMARSFGETPQQKDYYETNARTLVSVWGDSYHLSDYASRAWAGMLSSFYKVRWEMFLKAVMDSFKAGVPFDAKAFDARIWEFENSWAKSSHEIGYPEPGDPVATAREMLAKYRL